MCIPSIPAPVREIDARAFAHRSVALAIAEYSSRIDNRRPVLQFGLRQSPPTRYRMHTATSTCGCCAAAVLSESNPRSGWGAIRPPALDRDQRTIRLCVLRGWPQTLTEGYRSTNHIYRTCPRKPSILGDRRAHTVPTICPQLRVTKVSYSDVFSLLAIRLGSICR
jgi:hypothetical protein